MQIDAHLILRLEKLSNLQLDPAARERFAGDLDKIVEMVNHLQQLDTTGVDPLIWLSDRENALREDVISNQLTPEEGLRNAPAHDEQFFRAPKVTSKPV